MNRVKLRQIEAIAVDVRNRFADCAQAECYNASEILARRLRAAGFSAKRVQGSFYLDEPSWEEVAAVGEEVAHTPVHHWVEVDGYVVDVTADQFTDEVADEIPPIVIERRAVLWRYST